DASTFGGGLQHDLACAVVAQHLVRNGGLGEIHLEEILLGGLDALADGLRNFLGLARAVAHDALGRVADDDQRGEGHVLATLDDLGDAVDVDDLVLQLSLFASIFFFVAIVSYPAFWLLEQERRSKETLELQPGLARCVCQSLDAAMIEVAATIEDH